MSASPKRPVVVLGISGSIAAYKAVELARLLIKRGVRVRPMMTKAARRFVGPATLAGICGEPVHGDMFAETIAGELHVELAAGADVVALVPATADLLAALAQGRVGDLVRATALCAHPRQGAKVSQATRGNRRCTPMARARKKNRCVCVQNKIGK